MISVQPEICWHETEKVEDFIITKAQLASLLEGVQTDALIIRTLPNQIEKKHKNYSSSNPPYIELEAIEVLNQAGVEHLLIDPTLPFPALYRAAFTKETIYSRYPK